MKQLLFFTFFPCAIFGMGFSELITHNPIVEIPRSADLHKAFAVAGLERVAERIKVCQLFSNDKQVTKMHALSIIAGVDFDFEAWAIHNHESPDFDEIRKKKGAVIRVLCASVPEWVQFSQDRRLFDEVHVKNIYD